MDIISDVLERVGLSSTIYFKSDFTKGWGMDVPDGSFAQFHLVTRGQCLLKVRNEERQLFAGDIVLFPRGRGHWLADDHSSELASGMEVLQAIQSGQPLFQGEVVSTTLICGHFEYDRSMNHPLIKELPELIHIKCDDLKQLPWLESIANLVIHEADSNNVGSSLIINKLAEVLFVHTLRAYLLQAKPKQDFFAAIQDDRIGKALSAIHDQPEKDWQVASLAQTAGMSRTNFSNKFKELTGETPLSYVTNWRVIKAKSLLEQTSHSVGEIAEKVGYQSEAAFNRVFKKHLSQTPLKYRQMRSKSA